MNKKNILTVIFIFLLTFSGCGNTSSDAGRNEIPAVEKEETAAESETSLLFVSISSEIQELESGFSAVWYEGDYGFDRFLEQGGADSDQAVLEFLRKEFFPEAKNVIMDTGFFGCSTLSVESAEGGYLFGRNFDWQTCDALVVTTYPDTGYASVSTVNLDFIRQGAGSASGFLPDDMLTVAALYAPLDGMNEKGLCVSANMIQDGASIGQNTEKTDITTTTAVRCMLDRAATVEEALDLLEQYDLHASMNYMVHFAIADSSGNSVAVEYIDNEMIVIPTPVLTNFYLAEGYKQGIGTQQSHTRFEILTEILTENQTMTHTQVRDALDSVSKDNFGEFESTEWSIVFDQSTLTAAYYHRENYEDAYIFQISKAEEESDMSKSETEGTLRLFIGEKELPVRWEENESVEALRELVKEQPLSIQMSMYGGFEQVGALGTDIPRNDVQITTGAGDIVLYSGSQIVLFYGSNSWAYTRLGRITDTSAEEMAQLLGNGDVTITLSE
ncbi:MAG: linear amide C-N hydrolase [Lachnospiraceae bacterium]|nr:linear amide C-N hydrolase [Lachnospiraceae bacterium]